MGGKKKNSGNVDCVLLLCMLLDELKCIFFQGIKETQNSVSHELLKCIFYIFGNKKMCIPHN